MRMQVAHRSDGRVPLESYALYAAFAPIDEHRTLVKIGMTLDPFKRVYEVHVGSPFAVEQALWMHVGNKVQARRVEKTVHHQLAPYRTRGEWFLFDMTNAAQKEAFHAAIRFSTHRVIRRSPEWKRIDVTQLAQARAVARRLKSYA